MFLPSPQHTHALGVAIGQLAPPGAVLALQGDLGAGKTALAKGVGEGLGVPGVVTSPTFILVAEHPGGRLPLVHADLYRLGDASELEELGLTERVDEGHAVVLIEWAERFPEALPPDHLRVELGFEEPDGRRARLVPGGPSSAALAEALRRHLGEAP